MAFSQHDWLNDYFHFCLCWQGWQKDYIPVERKGETNPRGQMGFIVNQITCSGILLSGKNCSYGFGWWSVASSEAFRQVRKIHSCSSSSEGEIKKIPNITMSELLCASLGSSSNKQFFLGETNPFFSQWHFLEHVFFSVSLKDRVCCAGICQGRRYWICGDDWSFDCLFGKISLG